MLTPTGERMLATIPDYLRDITIVQRIIQAQANEVDRIDGKIDTLRAGMIPGTATDELGLLALWERSLGLAVRPPGVSVVLRQAAVKAALRKISAVTAGDVFALFHAIDPAINISRLGLLEDVIDAPFGAGTYSDTQVIALARAVWPAHRRVFLRYPGPTLVEITR